MRDFIHFLVNGKPKRAAGATAFSILSDFLRYDQGDTGTKVVCAEGDCGACTVLIGRPEGDRIDYRAVNSCIQSLFQLDGAHVVTVEGLSDDGQLNAVQRAMVENHAAQCGYCTPGFTVALCGLFDGRDSVSRSEIQDCLTGNLCRCTGYDPIIASALAVDSEQFRSLDERYPSTPLIEATRSLAAEPVLVEANGKTFFAPTDLADAARFKADHPKTVIVQGATDVGVWRNKRGFEPEAVLSLQKIDGLRDLGVENGVLKIGARVTLSELEAFVETVVPELHRILKIFGAPQIKNAGTLAGNIANASPIADTLPFLFVTDAEVELVGVNGTRRVNVNAFYLGYKTLDMRPDEFIVNIHVPLPSPHETLKLYKVSKRKDLDISSFTAAIRLARAGDEVETAKIAYGGVGPVVLRLPETERFLIGRPYTEDTFERAGKLARREITPISDVRGSAEFRSQLAENILLKFFHETSNERETVCP